MQILTTANHKSYAINTTWAASEIETLRRQNECLHTRAPNELHFLQQHA